MVDMKSRCDRLPAVRLHQLLLDRLRGREAAFRTDTNKHAALVSSGTEEKKRLFTVTINRVKPLPRLNLNVSLSVPSNSVSFGRLIYTVQTNVCKCRV